MSFVSDHCKPFTVGRCQFPDRLEGERKRLDRADNDFLFAGQRFGKFGTLAALIAFDGLDDACRPLEGVDRIL